MVDNLGLFMWSIFSIDDALILNSLKIKHNLGLKQLHITSV